MGQCKPIAGLKLDRESINTLERIKKKHFYGNALATMVSAGVVSNIFTKNSSVTAAYNITQTDWDLYARAMVSIPVITKTAIRKEVEMMVIHYQMHYNSQLLKFWQGVYDGCE